MRVLLGFGPEFHLPGPGMPEIPGDAVEPRLLCPGHRGQRLPAFIEDGDPHLALRRILQIIIDIRFGNGARSAGDAVQPVGRPWLEEMNGRLGDRVGELLQGRNIVHDPESPAVGRDHEVVEMRLDDHVMDGSIGQVVLERQPVFPIIERDIDRVLGAQVKEPPADRVLVNPMAVAEDALGNSRGQRDPGIPIIGRLVDERVAAVHLVEIDGEVGRSRIIAGWLNVAHGPPSRKTGNVFRDVCPGLSAVAGELDEAVVRARPDAAFLQR